MHDNEEVIDVEEFHESLQQKSSADQLKRKCYRLEQENKKLDSQVNNSRRQNDALSKKLFDQDQRRNELARLLGFENAEAAEANITSEDPWIPGGQAALSDARTRILLLEDELAKHITASTEAQIVLTDTNDQLKQTSEQLDEALEEANRLRAERDVARQEAERQALDAKKWRIEAQTILPEMQNLMRELQQSKVAQATSPPAVVNEKENIIPAQPARNASPFQERTNATSPTAVHSSPPAPDEEHYKQKYELLQTQYNALLESKQKVSKRYYEQVVQWKKFKAWLVKDDGLRGGKPSTQRRILRRRKVMEEIGPEVDPQDLELGVNTASAVQDGLARDTDTTLIDPVDGRPVPEDEHTTYELPDPPANTPPRLPVIYKPEDHPALPPSWPPFEESLTQASSVPASPHQVTPALNSSHSSTSRLQNRLNDSNVISYSQESLTQPSSVPSCSPVIGPGRISRTSSGQKATPKVIVVDSSPERDATVVKRNPRERRSATCDEDSSEQQASNPRIMSLKSEPETPTRVGTSQTTPKRLREHKRLRTTQPVSEPPPAHRTGSSSHRSPHHKRIIRRTSTVLVMDTPPHTSVGAIVRHHASPPISPHMQRLNRGKRKAVEMEEIEGDDDGNESDPFTAGSSRMGAKPPVFHTREEKAAHLKALNKKSHKAYMAEYMQFKGREDSRRRAAGKTVNGEFEINPDKNGGVNYQYDAVVRDQAERKRLEAGDCECCRDYYEAVGPLPPRLQAPLWRSPSSDPNQTSARPCRYANNGHRDEGAMSSPSAKAHAKAVDAHKRDISRHRHNWAPPKTPPDFWKIAFPDTQEVDDINRRANDMHARKLERVKAEANSNGRYRKRK